MFFRNSNFAFVPPLANFPHQWEECLHNKITRRRQNGEPVQF